MFNIDFDKLVMMLTPRFWFSAWWRNWFKTLLKPIKTIYTDYLEWRENNFAELRQNSQVMYLQKLLNDKFAPNVEPPSIYIEHIYTEVLAVYNRAEIENATPPPVYSPEPAWLYNRHSMTTAYAADEYCIEGSRVFKALTANTGFVPSENPDKWSDEGEIDYMWNRSEILFSNTFIVHVPSGLLFDEAQMKALLNKYKLFDKEYRIVID